MDILPSVSSDHPNWTVFVVDRFLMRARCDNHHVRSCTRPSTGRGCETPTRQAATIRHRKPGVVKQGRKNVEVAAQLVVNMAGGNPTRLTNDRRDCHRVLVHVQGKRAVPFPPEPVLPARKPVVTREDDKRFIAQAKCFKPVKDPSDAHVHGCHGGEVPG